MSQGNSIFSSPNGSSGDAPANPFASLGSSSAGQKVAANPFATASAEQESPFGFAAEEPVAEQKSQPKAPEKKSQPSAAPENPFQTSAPAANPLAEAAPAKPAETPSSPFSESSYDTLVADNPLASSSSAPATPSARQESAAPVSESNSDSQGASRSSGQRAVSQPPAQPAQPSQQPAQQPAQSSPPVAATPAQPTPAAPTASASTSAPAPAGMQSVKQLELRAIFGAEGEMTRDEILTRAKGLPGIREVTVVGSSELSAVNTMGDVLSRFGYGGEGSWQITCAGGVMDFISSEGATLAVLREGRYSGGVWETLMIVARELGKL